jgi:hypothetical protein
MPVSLWRDTIADMDLQGALDELYGVRPEDFLTTRTALVAQARAERDTATVNTLRSMRKPTAAAWAVNHLVRRRPDVVDRLRVLNARLRGAMTSSDPVLGRGLARARSDLVGSLTQAAVTLAAEAGVRLAPTAERGVLTTIVAALGHREAWELVASGRLTTALSYAGFGDIDTDEPPLRTLHVVREPEGMPWAHPASTAAPNGGAERDAVAAQARLHEAMAAATAATSRHGVLAAELELADARLASLTQEQARAVAHRDATAEALHQAQAAEEAAQTELRRARQALEQLRESPVIP